MVSQFRAVIAFTMKIYSVWDSMGILYYVLKGFGYISFTIEGKIENGKIRSTVSDVILATI